MPRCRPLSGRGWLRVRSISEAANTRIVVGGGACQWLVNFQVGGLAVPAGRRLPSVHWSNDGTACGRRDGLETPSGKGITNSCSPTSSFRKRSGTKTIRGSSGSGIARIPMPDTTKDGRSIRANAMKFPVDWIDGGTNRAAEERECAGGYSNSCFNIGDKDRKVSSEIMHWFIREYNPTHIIVASSIIARWTCVEVVLRDYGHIYRVVTHHPNAGNGHFNRAVSLSLEGRCRSGEIVYQPERLKTGARISQECCKEIESFLVRQDDQST